MATLFACGSVIPIVNAVTGIIFNIIIVTVSSQLWLNPESDMNLDNVKISGKLGKAFLLYLRIGICSFLWALLLIIPGIIYALNRAFSQFPLILDDKNITESLTISKELMTYPESKIRLFCVYLLYMVIVIPIFFIIGAGGAIAIGNNLVLSFFIGFFQLFATAYIVLTITGLYWDIRTRSEGLDIQKQINTLSAQ